MTVSEAELRRAMAVLDQYRAQLENLQRQQEIVGVSLEEYLRARETLARYREAGKGAQVLVPVGGNAFVFGSVSEADRAIIGIGADVLVEEPVDRALERLEARIKSVQEAATALSERIQEIGSRVQAQSEFVEGVYERLSEQGEAKGTKPKGG